MEKDRQDYQVPVNDLLCSINDNVISLVRDWKSISKEHSRCQREKLLCINNLERITATFEGSTSACGDDSLKPLLHVMREGLADGDPFVRYSAAKAYGNTMARCVDCQVDFTPLVQDMISSLPNIKAEYRVSIIDFMWHQTSTFLTEAQWLVLLNVMGQHWENICKSCLFDFLCDFQFKDSSISPRVCQKNDKGEVLACQFLRLWKRILKKSISNTGKKYCLEFVKPVLDLIKIFRSKFLTDRMTFRSTLKLILTVVKNMEDISNIGSDCRKIIIQIADEFMHCCSTEFFEEFPCGFKEGFAGELTVNPDNHKDMSILRTMSCICFKIVAMVPKLDLNSVDITASFAILISLDTWLSKTLARECFSWVPMVYSEQDDAWIDVLRTLLEIYTEGKTRLEKQKCLSDILVMIQPHKQFLLFLDSTGFDETFVVDLLISPETCFLTYFTKYLRVVASEWTEFVKTHSEYSCHGLLDSRCGSQDSIYAERVVNIQNAEKTQSQKINTVTAATSSKAEGLTMLQQYGFDDDDDDDGGDNGCDDDDGSDEDHDLHNDEEVENDNKDNDICKDDEEEKSKVKSVTEDSSCSGFNDQYDSESLDLQSANSSSCLDKTMAVLIRVRMKMEKFTDSSIIQYNPQLLVHLIEQVEELYEQ